MGSILEAPDGSGFFGGWLMDTPPDQKDDPVNMNVGLLCAFICTFGLDRSLRDDLYRQMCPDSLPPFPSSASSVAALAAAAGASSSSSSSSSTPYSSSSSFHDRLKRLRRLEADISQLSASLNSI